MLPEFLFEYTIPNDAIITCTYFPNIKKKLKYFNKKRSL